VQGVCGSSIFTSAGHDFFAPQKRALSDLASNRLQSDHVLLVHFETLEQRGRMGVHALAVPKFQNG
jgi:hypothetical protein